MFGKLQQFYHNYPWIIWTYLVVVVILDLIVLGYYLLKKEQFKDQIEENIWLKVGLYTLAILNFFLIAFVVIYLLAALSGGSRSVGRSKKGYRKKGRRRRKIIRYG